MTRLLVQWQHPTAPQSIAIHNNRLTWLAGKRRRFISALDALDLYVDWAATKSRELGGNVCTGVNGDGLRELAGWAARRAGVTRCASQGREGGL